MRRELSFYAFGKPAPQPRPRMARNGHVFNPLSANEWKKDVREAWSESAGEEFHRGVRMSLHFILERPKGHWTKSGKLKRGSPADPVGKPDLDNLAKSTLDSLENAGAFKNDSAILHLNISKRYAEEMEEQGCLISIAEID